LVYQKNFILGNQGCSIPQHTKKGHVRSEIS
jgi:hypothetical protein